MDTLFWAYWWLPVLNLLLLAAFFAILLGVSESQRAIFARAFSLPLPATGLSATEIFNGRMTGFLLHSLISWYISFAVCTSPAPIARFALIRRPLKGGILSSSGAFLCFGIGAALHRVLYASSAASSDLIIRFPAYVTMFFAFCAIHSILRCPILFIDDGREARGSGAFARASQGAGHIQGTASNPLPMTFDAPLGSRTGLADGSASFDEIGDEDLAGSIIRGSAHFGTGTVGQLNVSASRAETAVPEETATENAGKCLLCGADVGESPCIALPDGWKIHRHCYDEAAAKVSSSGAGGGGALT